MCDACLAEDIVDDLADPLDSLNLTDPLDGPSNVDDGFYLLLKEAFNEGQRKAAALIDAELLAELDMSPTIVERTPASYWSNQVVVHKQDGINWIRACAAGVAFIANFSDYPPMPQQFCHFDGANYVSGHGQIPAQPFPHTDRVLLRWDRRVDTVRIRAEEHALTYQRAQAAALLTSTPRGTTPTSTLPASAEPVDPAIDLVAQAEKDRFKLLELDPLPIGVGINTSIVAKGKEGSTMTPTGTSFRVKEVAVACLRKTTQYENDRVEMTAIVEDGADPIKVAQELRTLCLKSLAKED